MVNETWNSKTKRDIISFPRIDEFMSHGVLEVS